MAGFSRNFGTRGRALSLGLSIALFVILTSAVSLILWESTKYRPSGSSASSYSLRLEASNEGEFRDTYSFVQSCIMSESGSPCLPKSTAAAVYPGIFSSVSLPADVKPGRYRGIRVQIAGAHGRSLKVRSITLEGRKLFDGRGALPFRNTKGLSVRSDRRGGFAVLEIQSDSASFDLDCSFSVRGAPPAPVRYTGAVLAAVAFAATILLLSVIGAASRSGKRSLGERRPGPGGSRGGSASAPSSSIFSSLSSLPRGSSSSAMSLRSQERAAGRSASWRRFPERRISGMSREQRPSTAPERPLSGSRGGSPL